MTKSSAVLYAMSIKQAAPLLSPMAMRIKQRNYELWVNGLRTDDWMVAQEFDKWLKGTSVPSLRCIAHGVWSCHHCDVYSQEEAN